MECLIRRTKAEVRVMKKARIMMNLSPAIETEGDAHYGWNEAVCVEDWYTPWELR